MTEFAYIFVILLPVAWYFGYKIGRKKNSDDAKGNDNSLSKTYFKGLNYLLNEESDKALDSFVSLLEVDSDTLETHLALANLFRKKGEVERSIRIHQNLIARPSLNSKDRKLALIELGFDYMTAGLLDRAENIFIELSTDQTHKNTSIAQLLIIYEQTKEWLKAIAMAEQLPAPLYENYRTKVSHFYCELADEAIKSDQYQDSLKSIKKAISVDPSCVRANLISADIHFAKGRFKQAIKCYKSIMDQDIAFLSEAIVKMIDCYKNLDDRKGLEKFLHDALNRGGGITLILGYADLLQQKNGDREAADFIASQMDKHPSIKGLLKLIELHIEHASETARPSLMMLRSVVARLIESKPVYKCHHCGFTSKALFWHCPSCK